MLGKEEGFRFLANRIEKMWCSVDKFEMIDFKNNFFLISFSNDKDYEFALLEGPWMVAGHYLMV